MCGLCNLIGGAHMCANSVFMKDTQQDMSIQQVGRQQADQLQAISQQELARLLGALSQNAHKPKSTLKRWVSNPLEGAVMKGKSYMIGNCKAVEIKSLR